MIFTAPLPWQVYFQNLRPCDVFLLPFEMLLGDPRSRLKSEKAGYFSLHSGLHHPTGADTLVLEAQRQPQKLHLR